MEYSRSFSIWIFRQINVWFANSSRWMEINQQLTEYLASSQAQHFSASKASASAGSISQNVFVSPPSSAYHRTLFSSTMAVKTTHPDPDGGAFHITWICAKVRTFRTVPLWKFAAALTGDNAVESNINGCWPAAKPPEIYLSSTSVRFHPCTNVTSLVIKLKKKKKVETRMRIESPPFWDSRMLPRWCWRSLRWRWSESRGTVESILLERWHCLARVESSPRGWNAWTVATFRAFACLKFVRDFFRK